MIEGIVQPEMIEISDNLRLRKFDGEFMFALSWYQDAETLMMVDGHEQPYTKEKLERMYRYLDSEGELYFIEYLADGEFKPIGDITFWQDDMPIVIGDKNYWGKGIGKQVVEKLVERAKEIGYKRLRVGEIYSFNHRSKRLFEGMGFRMYEKTDKGGRYEREI